jgi:hypothetical protein
MAVSACKDVDRSRPTSPQKNQEDCALLFRALPLIKIYFLNKFSKAWRASLGRKAAGVEVSFSLVTRIS